jgi:N utilization substance protein B
MTTKPHAAAKPKSARRRAREFILQGLYQWRVGGADEAAIEAYAPEMEGFDKAELSPIEAGVLLLGSFELIHHPETPYRVIINEAIELAKAFGGTDGHKYVNGVLDKIAAQVRAQEVNARQNGR